MAMTVNIVSPAADAVVAHDTPIVVDFTIAGGSVDTAQIVITDPGGNEVAAWTLAGGAAEGYAGTVDSISDGIRVTLSRLIGFPIGTIEADASGTGTGPSSTTVWGPQTFTETDSVTSFGGSLITRAGVLPISIDGSMLPGSGALQLIFTAGEIQSDINANNFGNFAITVSNSPTAFVGDTLVWQTQDVPSGVAIPWTAIASIIALHAISGFTNPNPSGTFYLKFYGSEGGTGVECGVRNYTMRIDATGGGSSSASASQIWSSAPASAVDGAIELVSQAKSRVILQYREAPKLNAMIAVDAAMLQDVENTAVVIPTLLDPSVATGDSLDKISEIVGQDRNLGNGDIATDPQLRVLIGARITRNNTKIGKAGYLDALVQFFGARIIYTDIGGMAISYVVMRTPTADEIAVLNEDIVARPMGVRVSRSFSAGTGYFGWSDDPDALGFSEISDGGTTGGFWTELF